MTNIKSALRADSYSLAISSPFEGGQRGMTYLAKFIKVRNLFFGEVVLTIYWKFIKAYFCYD